MGGATHLCLCLLVSLLVIASAATPRKPINVPFQKNYAPTWAFDHIKYLNGGITGAASGIGEAAARLFAAHGALIVIADVQDDLGRSVAASIGADKCSYYHCDVRDEKQIEATVEYTINTYNRFDILYCNAGILGTAHSILDASMVEWDEMFAVNVRGVAAAIKHSGRAMVAQGTRGSIVCTASLAAFRGGHGVASYTAAKHAVLGLVRAAAGELGAHGIRVNAVSPSAVATPLGCKLNGWSQSKLEEYGSAVASLKGVVLKARDIAEAALFLAADEAAFITGHNLVVDGGRTVVSARIQQYYDE